MIFDFFKEVGIIEQLSRARLEARLPDGLIAPHFAVLNHLTMRGDGAVPIDMARAFQVPKTSMTHTIKGLVQHGLVEMRSNPDDGRSKRVWLTDKGIAMRQEVITALGADFALLAKGFDMAALARIKPTLTALREYLDDARDVTAGG
ncbi:MarR family winged helix-turn-helix transcriptional regulator [Sulfitobacter sp. M368]|uniref:MarR family winged helix-turn-helix transcriptional regulator n=1 Tax=Sulfitobacter sp. M368 TaxID=2867021 RepID=UPI0021A8BAA8|nr:MarR family transcriptional regulator [Sulfitobacter sp. M368]UWR14480.1 winged helix DNA-binding protein [Sulfitobacter sp. M368]